MKKVSCLALCALFASATIAFGQKSTVPPLRYAAGTVLTFHLQTRLNPAHSNDIDGLPKGTAIQVKLLVPIDSTTENDGARFRGELAAPVAAANGVVLHSGAEVNGILALLRNRTHPDGFRYELLITGVTDRSNHHATNYELTASLSPSVFEAPATVPVSETQKTHATTAAPAPPLN